MSESQSKRIFSSHLWVIYSLSVILVIVIWINQWILGLLMTLFLVASFYYSLRTERKLLNETEEYISTLSHRLEKVGAETLLEMPIGIILFNEEYQVEWVNPYMNEFISEETLVGQSLNNLSDNLVTLIQEDNDQISFQLDDFVFETMVKKEEQILYLLDQTSYSEIKTLYEDQQTVISIIYLDNYEEITQNMDDTVKSKLNSNVTSVLNSWSNEHGVYLKRTSQDRFLAIFTQSRSEERRVGRDCERWL